MSAAAGRLPISLDWSGVVETYPTVQPMVNVDGIATYATLFPRGWGGAGLPAGVAADVAFLRSWEMPESCYYGNSQVGMHRFITEPAGRPHTAELPTASAVLADLLVKYFVGRPGVALDTVKPPCVPAPFAAKDGGDQVHTDGGK